MKSQIIKAVGTLGGYRLARRLTANQPKLLMYHRFSKDESSHAVCEKTFEKQLRLIKNNFNPMTLAEVAAIQHSGRAIPKHAVVITVDDGYRDFYELAYPLLKHHSVPATFYVTTGFINKDLWLWPDQVLWLLNNRANLSGNLSVANQAIQLDRHVAQVWQDVINLFLSVSNQDRILGLKKLELSCGVALPQTVPDVYAACDWRQLIEMQDAGIEIGGHTVSHPSLGHMTDAEVKMELQGCMQALHDNLGPQSRTFCYPNGQPEDYSDRVKALTEEAGFTAAVTAFSDQYNTDIPYAWRRFVGAEDSFQFHKSLFGVEHIGNRVRKTSRCGY